MTYKSQIGTVLIKCFLSFCPKFKGLGSAAAFRKIILNESPNELMNGVYKEAPDFAGSAKYRVIYGYIINTSIFLFWIQMQLYAGLHFFSLFWKAKITKLLTLRVPSVTINTKNSETRPSALFDN